MEKLAFMAQGRWVAPVSFLLLLAAYHLIFGQFFPTMYGTLGHDYSRVLPDLLDGYFWFRSNGLFEPFWFTPAFCGGQPALGDPQSGFYSVAQFLGFFLNPLASVYTTVLLFASLGFWGFYLLLRSCFGASRQAAVLGAALFMFNGFFIHRMMIGHFAFHGVMLIPGIAWFLLRPAAKSCAYSTLLNGIAVGCMLAYGFYSGMVHLLLPCTAAVLAIACVHGLAGREATGFVQRSLFAALVVTGLAAAKLLMTLSYLHNFPRSDYSLPGVSSLWNALRLLFSMLFFSPADIAEQALPLIQGMQWALDRHEWEYGVTLVPLLIILAAAGVLFRTRGALPQMNAAKWAWLALLGFILALPLALNIYTPGWNAFLKQVPVIKSSSNLLRWFVIYIPIVILAAALLLDRISAQANRRNALLIAALAALILINAVKDRTFYQTQPYRPGTIINAWQAASNSTAQARIQYIGTFADTNTRMKISGNDLIAAGASQLGCYNPMFGYRLENFPIKSLRPGPVMAEMDGRLNIKNPACYLYPQENSCVPGDHFTLSQRDAAQAFADYKPYPFELSSAQQIANWVTLITLTLLALLFAIALFRKILRSFNAK